VLQILTISGFGLTIRVGLTLANQKIANFNVKIWQLLQICLDGRLLQNCEKLSAN
jgi:hypothetical protein